MGFISQPNNSALSQYKNVPLHHFEALISQTKQTIKDKGVSSFDDIADIFYNMIKVNLGPKIWSIIYFIGIF